MYRLLITKYVDVVGPDRPVCVKAITSPGLGST